MTITAPIDPDTSVREDSPSPTATSPTTNEAQTYSSLGTLLDEFAEEERTAKVAAMARLGGISVEQASEIQAQVDRAETARYEVAQVLAAHLASLDGESRSREAGAVLSKAHWLLRKGYVRK